VTPKRLFIAGAALALITGVLGFFLHTNNEPNHPAAPPPPPTTTTTATTTAPPPTTTAPPPPPTTTTAPPPPSPVPMSWEHAGVLVWHDRESNPEWLGKVLRDDGFGWVAVFLGQAGSSDPPADLDWITRFRTASGLPVGGWSVLEGDPKGDAARAASLIAADGLSFYIADAELPYQQYPQRSQEFVTAFRAAEPHLPAGLSSLCDAQGINLAPWASAGFTFLPQAYVNDFGTSVSPAACVREAAPWFPRSEIHPTVAGYNGQLGWVTPQRFSQLLARAGTTGFSVYPGEVVSEDMWLAYGQAITSLHIAERAG
jgi:hypothetical protein